MPFYLWPEILAMVWLGFWFEGWDGVKKEDHDTDH